jgi:hypothetical protein
MSILADFGQFIDINGKSSTTQVPPSKSTATLVCIDMPHVVEARSAIVSQLFQRAFKDFAFRGNPSPPVQPITNLSSLLKEQRTSTTVLSLGKTTPILVPAPQAPELKLQADGSHILAGGLGALGLNIAD